MAGRPINTGALQDRCLRAMQSATRERRESRSCRGDMLISIGKCKWQGYKYKTRGHALYGDGKMRWPEQVDLGLEEARCSCFSAVLY